MRVLRKSSGISYQSVEITNPCLLDQVLLNLAQQFRGSLTTELLDFVVVQV